MIRVGLLALLLAGCGDRAATGNEAITAANTYLATMPQLGARHRTVSAIDMGDRWRLSYDMPPGSTGGPLIVVVNKRSGEVVHIETEQ